MACPTNHKTVFVLDQNPTFSTPCDPVEFDFHKARATLASNYIPAAPIHKTMWTCATEAVLEYCRIVWDIFPSGKLVRFIVGNQDGTDVNDWSDESQNSAVVAAGFARCGRPQDGGEGDSRRRLAKGHNLMNSLSKALEALCQPTQAQLAASKKGNIKLVNRGRIVCLTHFPDDRRLNQLVMAFKDELTSINQKAEASDDLMEIDEVELEIVHCFPPNMDCTVTPTPEPLKESSSFTYHIQVTDAAQGLAKKMLYMALTHYQLASTTGKWS